MKEMVGGCCVCSDERGWPENPLVYCDGQGCTVAVHQACYGIVTVPTGPWYCRKCESQERSARVRCELCPSRDGALKRTDNAGWAHVVCALYIPEVRFGNVTTMEPIILQLIPAERFNKLCYICEEMGKANRANVGACMQCNKAGCKQQFHVTCAQTLGLLCEEAGNYLDNVKYCGYCQHHYSKLKKSGNVKTIPPYKPVPAVDSHSSDSSPEKDADTSTKSSSSLQSNTNITSASSSKRNKSSSNSNKSNSSLSKTSSNSSSAKTSTTNASSGQNHQKSGAAAGNTSGVHTSNSGNSNKLGANIEKLNKNSSSSSSSTAAAAGGGATSQQNTNISVNKKSSSNNSELITTDSTSTTPIPQVLLSTNSSDKTSSVSSDKIPTVPTSENSLSQTKYNLPSSLAETNSNDSETKADSNSTNNLKTSTKKRKAGSRTPTPNQNLTTTESDSRTNVSTIVAPTPVAGTTTNSNILNSALTSTTSSSSLLSKSTSSTAPQFHDTRSNPELGDKVKKIKTEHSSSSPKTGSPLATPTSQAASGSPLISTNEHISTTGRPHSNNSANNMNVIQPVAAQSPRTASPHNSLVVSVPLSNTLLNSSSNGAVSSATNVPNQSTSVLTNSSTTPSVYQQSSVLDAKSVIGPNTNINPMVSLEPLTAFGNISTSDGGLKITYEKQTSDSPNSVGSASRQSSVTPMDTIPDEIPEKRSRSQSVDNKPEKTVTTGRGKKRGSGGGGLSQPATSTTAPSSTNTTTITNKRSSRSQNQISSPVQGAFSSVTQHPPPPPPPPPPTVKESPPSSPGSEAASSIGRRNKGRNKNNNQTSHINSNSNSHDSKDVKIFQNGINAPHMLGNQLNPNSHMAQKMSDHLNSELEAHSIFSADALPANSLVGPQLHSRVIASTRNNSNQSANFSALNSATNSTTTTVPQTLDQLLERQWEQGSQFLMEQAQHFDIASLLSCLHQLRAENLRLEEHVSNLLQRRDHLLAVNARLAIPLTSQQPITASTAPTQTHSVNNMHPSASMPVAANDVSSSRSRSSGSSGTGTNYNNVNAVTAAGIGVNQPIENGLPGSEHLGQGNGASNMYATGQQTSQHNRSSNSQPSPTIRHSQSSSYVPTSSSVQQHSVLRGSRSNSVPDNSRGNQSSQSSSYNSYHQGQMQVVTSQTQHQQQVNIRRDNSDIHHSMGTASSKPS